MADGGEGTLDALLTQGGERRTLEVRGAGGTPRSAHFAWFARRASPEVVIESAEVIGITDPAAMAVPVTERSSRGLGELMATLLDAGVRTFLVGLGGTSTNDGGAGLLSALGVGLFDAAGRTLPPTPSGLQRLARVDTTALDPRLAESTLTILSDVTNPLCGERGATAVFGPQKGVPARDIPELDARLARFAALLEAALGRSSATNPGAGAAGGLGFALQLLGGHVRSGADVVADWVGLDAALDGADWAITGEGQSDAQTLHGKAPSVVARRACAAGVPTTLLSGAVDGAALPELDQVFAGCFGLPAGPLSLADSMAQTSRLLSERAQQIALLWRAARG
jgi:glycerate kinase